MLRVVEQASRSVAEECAGVELEVAGEIPRAIDGALFRNGPGRFERGSSRYLHPFDGDGHLVRLEFRDGRVRLSNRFVRTREYLAEEHAGRMCYRAFGTNLPGGLPANALRFPFKNAANTSVIWQGGRLLALWEGGPPHRIDPESLETLGPEDFDGALRNRAAGVSGWLARRVSPLLPFSAHPRLDAGTGELINFGLVFGRPNRLLLYRVDAGGHMASPRSLDLPRFSFVHDIAVTRRWLCILLPHADFAALPALLGLKTPVGSLRVHTGRPMQALLLPRGADGAPGEPRLIEAVPGFVFHIAQAFDRDDGALALDLVHYRGYPAFDDLPAWFSGRHPEMVPRLERLVIDPSAGDCRLTGWGGRAWELPTTRPGGIGEERHLIYGIGAPADREVPYLTAIQRLDTRTGEVVARDFWPDLPGEPIPVPGPDGGEGWLLSLVHRAGAPVGAGACRTDLVVLRAADLALVASATLPVLVPAGFHGCWVPRVQRPPP
jgi:all-trans-8'-apo-beta-carotenal 15,15'-oxygenase